MRGTEQTARQSQDGVPAGRRRPLRAIRVSGGKGQLIESPARDRWEANRRYVRSLTAQNLLRPYLTEAGLWSYGGSCGTTIGGVSRDGPESWHWGWEAPTCELRGHILGHWLSAASRLGEEDPEIEARARIIVADLARCQQANGGEWIGPFPPAYLNRLAARREVWAPHYTLHKIIMGLLDQYRFAGNEQALEIASRFARWFHRWTDQFTRAQFDDILDCETGGMLEAWADLYDITNDPTHRELLDRYDRPRFFEPLLAGHDVLTNKHANTQVAEVLGAARAWEVTGEDRWRAIVDSFWRSAVSSRGTYCTGGSTAGEVWQPPLGQSARLHSVQEHCVVFNMMRLSEYLLRWTGDHRYADYWERNLVNGTWAQQHPDTGMPSYFLPLAAGSQKAWGRPTQDFWCCHGTLMQAHATPAESGVFSDDTDIWVAQYLPATVTWNSWRGGTLHIRIENDTDRGLSVGQRQTRVGTQGIQQLLQRPLPQRRPSGHHYSVTIRCEPETEFTVRLRVPTWVADPPQVRVDGQPHDIEVIDNWIPLTRRWSTQSITVSFSSQLTTWPLDDDPDTVAVLDGPLVLAGLVDHEATLHADPAAPATFLTPDQERHHSYWKTGTYRTVGQERGFRFVPLNQVREETYTVYFPTTRRHPSHRTAQPT